MANVELVVQYVVQYFICLCYTCARPSLLWLLANNYIFLYVVVDLRPLCKEVTGCVDQYRKLACLVRPYI